MTGGGSDVDAMATAATINQGSSCVCTLLNRLVYRVHYRATVS